MIIKLPIPKYQPYFTKTVYPFAILPKIFTIIEPDRGERMVIVWLERYWQDEEHCGNTIRIRSNGPLLGERKLEYKKGITKSPQ
jgi:hypothetical protein